MFTKQEFRVYGPRTLAALMAGWAAYLAVWPPTLVRTTGSPPYEEVAGTYTCEAPIRFAFTDDVDEASSRFTPYSERVSERVDQACRDRATGTGVAVGLLGTGVAVLLGFSRPIPRRAKTGSDTLA